jgi:hypothetical protein
MAPNFRVRKLLVLVQAGTRKAPFDRGRLPELALALLQSEPRHAQALQLVDKKSNGQAQIWRALHI